MCIRDSCCGSTVALLCSHLVADVVTLALEHDIDLIQNTGLIDKGWIDEFSDSSAPYTLSLIHILSAHTSRISTRIWASQLRILQMHHARRLRI